MAQTRPEREEELRLHYTVEDLIQTILDLEADLCGWSDEK